MFIYLPNIFLHCLQEATFIMALIIMKILFWNMIQTMRNGLPLEKWGMLGLGMEWVWLILIVSDTENSQINLYSNKLHLFALMLLQILSYPVFILNVTIHCQIVVIVWHWECSLGCDQVCCEHLCADWSRIESSQLQNCPKN